MKKKYIDNSLFIEAVSEIAEKTVELMWGETRANLFIEDEENNCTRYSDEAQDLFNDEYDRIEAILNRCGMYSDNEEGIKYARKCDITGEGMNEGYCIQDGMMYIKGHHDMLQHITDETDFETIEEAYDEEYYYYTEWKDEDEYEYIEINGVLTEIND